MHKSRGYLGKYPRLLYTLGGRWCGVSDIGGARDHRINSLSPLIRPPPPPSRPRHGASAGLPPGCGASIGVRVELRRITPFWTVMDAGLVEGANSGDGLCCFTSDTAQVGREALRRARGNHTAGARARQRQEGGDREKGQRNDTAHRRLHLVSFRYLLCARRTRWASGPTGAAHLSDATRVSRCRSISSTRFCRSAGLTPGMLAACARVAGRRVASF